MGGLVRRWASDDEDMTAFVAAAHGAAPTFSPVALQATGFRAAALTAPSASCG